MDWGLEYGMPFLEVSIDWLRQAILVAIYIINLVCARFVSHSTKREEKKSSILKHYLILYY